MNKEETDGAQWQAASYEQFLREDLLEDVVCHTRRWLDSAKPYDSQPAQRMGSTESRPTEERFA